VGSSHPLSSSLPASSSAPVNTKDMVDSLKTMATMCVECGHVGTSVAGEMLGRVLGAGSSYISDGHREWSKRMLFVELCVCGGGGWGLELADSEQSFGRG
jgi:hypothetical protein